jgi:hypothetical protein
MVVVTKLSRFEKIPILFCPEGKRQQNCFFNTKLLVLIFFHQVASMLKVKATAVMPFQHSCHAKGSFRQALHISSSDISKCNVD